MRLIITDNPEAVAEWAAAHVRKRILEFNPGPGRLFTLGLPTGSTPLPVYRRLVQYHRDGQLSFRYVMTFNMDEYVGLPRGHAQSYRRFMDDNFFKYIDIDPAHTHIPDGCASDLQAECDQYEARIAAAGGIRLFLGGIGSDGHIAFNEPCSSLTSRTRPKTIADDTVQANARFFDGDVAQVPRMSLTVGVGTVMDSDEVMVLVTGAHKAHALRMCVEEPVCHMWTASALQHHPRCVYCVDEAATMELRVRTVKYARSVMGD